MTIGKTHPTLHVINSKQKEQTFMVTFFEVFPECNSCFNSFVSLSTAPWCFFFRFFVTIKSGGFFWKYLWLFNLSWREHFLIHFCIFSKIILIKSIYVAHQRVDQKVCVWLHVLLSSQLCFMENYGSWVNSYVITTLKMH